MKTYRSRSKPNGLAQALGGFSLALGLTEMIMPGTLARFLGVRNRRMLFNLLGAREVLSGMGILSQRSQAGWLWSRVAGDAMDLALLGAAFASRRNHRSRLAAATAAVAGVTMLDLMASRRASRDGQPRRNGRGDTYRAAGSEDHAGIFVRKATTIERAPEELYQFWRNFENLPRFMPHLETVRVESPARSHWIAKAPADATVQWDSEITEDRPNELIAWRSLPGGDVQSTGQVRFSRAPGNRGTVVTVEMEYQPPGGALGATIAKLFRREPGQQVHDSLRIFKQLMETGVIPTTKGQPAGRKSSTSKKFDYETPAPQLPRGETEHLHTAN